MAIANHYYNKTTKKYIAIFGALFNKLKIVREDNDGNEIQSMIVPLSYGPYQKFLARVNQDPELNRETAITLPRMAFEMNSMTYDPERTIAQQKRLSRTNGGYFYSPAPYDIEMSLYIMTKYSEDGAQLVEQIIPFFRPDWSVTAKLVDGLDPVDISIVLNSVDSEDIYEGDFQERRSLLWTLSFTIKGWFYGPSRSSSVIKMVDARFFTDTDADTEAEEQVIVKPGLTANGEPTTSDSASIDYDQIDAGDDWGIIEIYNKL